MEDLNWRSSFNDGMTNIHSIMNHLETEMKLEVKNVHHHLMNQSYNHIVIIFLSTILPIFTQNYPEIDTASIFDLFLLDG